MARFKKNACYAASPFWVKEESFVQKIAETRCPTPADI
tara:strand:+ start:475 stop:588 length:114 start_codon:yes stop_codon:yes gene_type:complete